MTINNIDSATLKKWLNNNEAVLIDVREPAENAAEKISGSNLIPLAQITVNSLPKHEGKKLVLHCRSGKRSESACRKLLEQNQNLEIFNLEGGIMGWISAGNKVESSGKFFLPLDRQVQLTIGISVLTGTSLGYLINPQFLIIPAFFGAGLCFAAITGTCALATLLAKMPWNKNSQKIANFCSTK